MPPPIFQFAKHYENIVKYRMIDIINSIFEFISMIVAIVNINKIIKDKEIKGVYWPAWIFYSLWAFWTVYFYLDGKYWWSTIVSFFTALSILTWLLLAIKYRNKNIYYK